MRRRSLNGTVTYCTIVVLSHKRRNETSPLTLPNPIPVLSSVLAVYGATVKAPSHLAK
jgi:hypothetical protein